MSVNVVKIYCYLIPKQKKWREIPTNFFDDVLQATQRAIDDGKLE